MSPKQLEDDVLLVALPCSTWAWLWGAAMHAAERELDEHPDQDGADRRVTAILLSVLQEAATRGASARLDDTMTEGRERLDDLLRDDLGGPLDVADRAFVARCVLPVDDELGAAPEETRT